MDRHRLAVVVERDDFQEPTGSVGTDVEITVTLAHYADGVSDCVLDVFVGNTVLTRVVRDLHLCRLPCPAHVVQVTLTRRAIWSPQNDRLSDAPRLVPTEWETSLLPKDGGYVLPVEIGVRTREQVGDGDMVTVAMSIASARRPPSERCWSNLLITARGMTEPSAIPPAGPVGARCGTPSVRHG